MEFLEVDAHWYESEDGKYAISEPNSPYHSDEEKETKWVAHKRIGDATESYHFMQKWEAFTREEVVQWCINDASGKIEKGAASILITLNSGTITVTHGTDKTPLFEVRNVAQGSWEQLWNAIKSIQSITPIG